MKIERITLCNIASLAGTFTVDFTKDPLKTAGLFSISGATGAGKSTLLDALCLALFDQTPRLNQVGRLAELTNGEKQSDTRSLLRRGTTHGFAEVAFVGVDQQSWTSRWSVRRGHNKADGNLQQAEMTLYRGHIAPGGQGVIEEGGKKTLVKEAIVAKIGLTFEQFTRAVLLAQNDFATFLKADDKERAEILQALTGTERFEAISRAVYARYSDEKKKIETLEAQLQGYQPLSPEARAEKEANAALATAKVSDLEVQFNQLKSHVEWHQEHTKRLADLQKSRAGHNASIQCRDAASERRAELQRTESVARDARSLRDADIRATKNLAAANAGQETASKAVAIQRTILQDAKKNHENAATARTLVQRQQQTATPQLKQARELDTKLALSKSRIEKSTVALANATVAVNQTTKTRNDAAVKKQSLERDQQTLQTQRDALKMFAPFVKEAATWQHRLDTAIAAQSEAQIQRQEFAELSLQVETGLSELTTKTKELLRLEQQSEAATSDLKKAEAGESEFDAEHLASQRAELDAVLQTLTTLQLELHQQQEDRLKADSVASELADLETTQEQKLATLQQLQNIEIPAAIHGAKVAGDLLEIMRAAVDDHAKRLRLSLQPDHPCPVCGSESHPYRDHAPDVEAAAINAAKAKYNELEKHRDTLKRDEQRLSISTQSAAENILKQQQNRTALLASINKLTFSSAEHPAVAEILAMHNDLRSSHVLKSLEAHETKRLQVSQYERSHREATKQALQFRRIAEEAATKLRTQQQLVNELEKQHGVTTTKCAGAESSVQKSEQHVQDAIMTLSELFNALPGASEEFASDARKFRDTFFESTCSLNKVEEQLNGLSSSLREATAVAGPLDEGVQAALKVQSDGEVEQRAASTERDELLLLRHELFDGRAADLVENEFTERLRLAELDVTTNADARHDAEKHVATAETSQKHAADFVKEAMIAVTSAQDSMTTWLQSFNANLTQPLSIEDVDRMLARDATWIETERGNLKQLDERVTATASACTVHEQQLQQHNEKRPTTDEETVVLATVQRIQEDLRLAKEQQETQLEIVRNDDRHRQQNAALTQRLADQQNLAEPWLKLNELIGSKEGDKFRMIAQRHTLDVLLGYANHQLTQLSTRYCLERIPESLNLVVIDGDMGEDRRSVHSLSGGESFLVSLAHALGLASLTSNRLRIESLFIDEGFGSLDSETLVIAMNALTHLESQGRKVGVISHVTEMTDAIPVQIKIEKRRSGGSSRIVIPGADPDWVNPKTDSELSTNTTGGKPSAANPINSDEVQSVADAILAILQREALLGKSKVSTTALRKEIDCRAKDFSAAQALLNTKIVIDGRSLRLAEL